MLYYIYCLDIQGWRNGTSSPWIPFTRRSWERWRPHQILSRSIPLYVCTYCMYHGVYLLCFLFIVRVKQNQTHTWGVFIMLMVHWQFRCYTHAYTSYKDTRARAYEEVVLYLIGSSQLSPRDRIYVCVYIYIHTCIHILIHNRVM